MLKKLFGAPFGRLTSSLGRLLGATGVHPNFLTVLGFLIVAGAAALIAGGKFVAGGVTLLVGASFDLLDGGVAKSTGKASKGGAFLDSSLDRLSDGLILAAFAWHFHQQGPQGQIGFVLALAALVLGFLVSYIKARAEGLGFECNIGIAERAERIVILALGLILGIAIPALSLLVAMSAVTVVQRFAHVWRQAT